MSDYSELMALIAKERQARIRQRPDVVKAMYDAYESWLYS